MVKIALSKGRLLKQVLPLLADVGIRPREDPFVSRKLILDTNLEDLQLVIIRATDVPTYVQFGAADLGVVGKDVLMEHGGDGLAELLDMRISRCRMMVAGRADPNPDAPESVTRRLRVATQVCERGAAILRFAGCAGPISSSSMARWSLRRSWAWPIVSLTWSKPGERCARTSWSNWSILPISAAE